MERYIFQIVIIFSLSGLFACAGTSDDAGASDARRSNCIYQPTIRGYVVLDEANLIIEASGRRKYHVGLRRRALGLRSSWSISFDSTTSRVCTNSNLLFDGGFGVESMPVAFVRELLPDEEEVLLVQFGKKEPDIKQTPAPADLPGAEVEELDSGSRDDRSGT